MECLPRHEHVSQESTLISLWCNDVDRKDFVDIEIYTYYEGLPNLTLRPETPPPPPCLVKKANTVVIQFNLILSNHYMVHEVLYTICTNIFNINGTREL